MNIALLALGISALLTAIILPKIAQALYYKHYAQHLDFEIPQKSYVGIFIVICAIIAINKLFIHYYFPTDSNKFYGGFALVILTFTIVKNLMGILVYYQSIKHPEDIEGTTHFKKSLVRLLALASALPVTLALCVVPLFVYDAYTLGCALGALVVLIAGVLDPKERALY